MFALIIKYIFEKKFKFCSSFSVDTAIFSLLVELLINKHHWQTDVKCGKQQPPSVLCATP